MTTAIETIRIGEDEIQGIRDGQGAAWVVVRRLCDVLALDPNGQQQRLRDADRAPWATTCAMHAVAEDGKVREVFCLHADSVPMWLATINAGQCAEREKVIRFQREAARVLADWAYGRKPSALTAALDLRDPAALQRLALELTGIVQEQQKALAVAAPKVEAFDAFLEADGLHGLQNAAKMLGLPHPRLWIGQLRSEGFLFSEGGALVPFARWLEAGLFVVKARVVDEKTYRQTYVTNRGLEFFRSNPFPPPAKRLRRAVIQRTNPGAH